MFERRGKWQRDQSEKQHQEFRVAEVVLEHARSEHGDDGGKTGASQRAGFTALHLSPQVTRRNGHEPEPHNQRRNAALGGDLDRLVVKMRICRVHRIRIFLSIGRVIGLDHHRSNAEQRVIPHHVGADLPHHDAIATGGIGGIQKRLRALLDLAGRDGEGK